MNALAFPEPNARECLEIPPVPYKLKPTRKRIGTFDTETDPFAYGVIVKPFTCGFATSNPHENDIGHFDYVRGGKYYKDFWGQDCIHQFFEWLRGLEGEYVVYVHNGGNFDFYFMLEYLDRGQQPFIINGRLVRMNFQGQEFRDSYSLLPVPLAGYKKDEISYDNFVPEKRDAFKREIQDYQRNDCFYLLELVEAAQAMFGDKLTMASVALPMLRSFHGFETMDEATDEGMRPFYFGGRNQCFEVGDLKPNPGQRFYIYDVNSMYPYVMANVRHPISNEPIECAFDLERIHFAEIDAWSDGALPIRKPNGGLHFPRGNGRFFASVHEIKAGLDTGTLRINAVHRSIRFEVETTFDEFINTYYGMRLEAKAKKDEILTLFYKLVMNSSYGKLAQDPRKYEQFLFDPENSPTPLRCWECNPDERKRTGLCQRCADFLTSPTGWDLHTERDGVAIYSRPSVSLAKSGFYNVATAASITGAARAYLLRGISRAKRPIYCDTDSIICEGFDGDIDPSRLGAWKPEDEGNRCCVAGKKLYAVFDDDKPVKSASKGVKLTPAEIARVCQGETLEYAHPVPKFSLLRPRSPEKMFTKRRVKSTGVVV